MIGIRPRQTWQCNGPGIIPLNAEDAAGLRELFAGYRFGAVLNCVGNCALKSCECDPAMAQLRVDFRTALGEYLSLVLAGSLARFPA